MASLITPIDIVAVVFGLFLGGLLLWQYRAVSQAFIDCLKSLGNCLHIMFRSGNDFRKKMFSRTAFFWLVNLVFMAISAYHAAPFFGSVISSVPGLEAIGPYIGLPVAFVMDGITIVFMQARLEANYKHDKKKSGMYIRYVFASAALNTLANLYTDIQHFDASRYNKVGDILLFCAPLVLSIFPMFLVAISKAADEMVNVKPLEDIDVEEYKKDEEKRVSILEAQNEFLDREAQAEQRLIEIEMRQKENENRRRGKAPRAPKVEREFLLARWFFPQRQMVIDTPQVVNETVKAMKELYEPRLFAITQHNQVLQEQVTAAQQLINDMLRLVNDSQVQMAQFQSVIRSDIGEVKTDLIQSLEAEHNGGIVNDLQSQIEQIRMLLAANLVTNKSENKSDLEVSSTSKSEVKESEQTTKEIPANYGLSDAEVQALILAFPGTKEWFDDMRSSLSESEIMEAANTRLNSLKGAIANHTIKPARGRGNKLQTETVLLWLLGRLKRSANRSRNTGLNTPVNSDEIQENREPNTGEMEAIKDENHHANGNGNGHATGKLNMDNLVNLEV